jgi:putative nucleotidyltransferase with HDIG domain
MEPMQSVAEFQPVTMPERLCNLPPFPAVANQVLSLAADPNVDLRRIADAFRGDPAFAAEVLVMANSPLFGLQARVHSTVQALAVLGMDRVGSLAMTVALRVVLGSSGEALRRTWRHSAATALVCQHLASGAGVQTDRAYTAGLLHDVGRLGLLKSYRAEIEPAIGCSYESPAEAMRVERTLVKVTHAEAGAWLVKTWGLPEAYYDLCLCHHNPFDPRDSDLLRLLKAGCRMATALGFGALAYGNAAGYGAIVEEAFPGMRIVAEDEMRERVTTGLESFMP